MAHRLARRPVVAIDVVVLEPHRFAGVRGDEIQDGQVGGLDGLAHTLAVGGVCLGAVLDVALDRLLGGAVDRPGGVVEQRLLLGGVHQPEQVSGLLEVVVVVLAIVESVGGGADCL
mgnify:CR=1 FL=1